jgi:hypothetical protein
MAALALNFSISALSELYIENRKPGEFFLYIFVGITCGDAAASHAPTELQSIFKFPKATVSRWGGE